MIELCLKEKTQHFLHPIIDWTEKEIWQYIRVNKLPYCSLYDEGWKRIGCVMCPMNTNRTHEAERWPKISDAYRRAADRFWARRIAVKGKEYLFQTSDEFWEWWISNKSFKKTGQQEMMLE
jgi:phosphoadenosine phosphosulfate reductase